MSAKSLRKSETLRLDPALYGALSAYATHRGARSLAAAARLAIRAHLAGEPLPPLRPVAPRRPRPLRLQLERTLRRALAAQDRSPLDALRSYFSL